jgi:hypothetical protein
LQRLNHVYAGAALWYETSLRVGLHLTVVLTDPYGDPPKVAVVHATDADNDIDWTTRIYPGEHPRIRKLSCIVNAAAKLVTVDALKGEVEYGAATQVEDFSPALLERVRKGVLEKGAADEEVDDFLLDHIPNSS